MTTITHAEKSDEVLPQIFFNHTGDEEWGGRHVSELSHKEFDAVLSFCRREGYRQGLNDAVANQIGRREDGPFHNELLNGVPAQEWRLHYQAGVDDDKREPSLLPDHVFPVDFAACE